MMRRHLVVDDLKQRIEAGDLRAGDRLPSMVALCERYGVSDITIRAALKELETAGYVEGRRRSGVFVREQKSPEVRPQLSGEKVIALLVPAWDDAFFARIIRGAEEEAERKGYRLVVVNSRGDTAQEAQQLKSLAFEVAGLLIVPLGARSYASYTALLERNVPFVFIDRFVEKLSVPVIATDNEQGGYLATRHLLDCGLQDIFVLMENNGEATSLRDRLAGCKRAFKEAGQIFQPEYVRISPEAGETAGYTLALKILEEKRVLEKTERLAIFALNDVMARGAYVAIREAGLRIPHDVAVVGFDDLDAAFFTPPLSTVRQPIVEIGAAAARTLVEMLLPGKTKKARSVLLQPQIIVRNSSDLNSDFCIARHILHGDGEKQPPVALETVSG
jgi:DNA-binding LacI/PurR family transcriptional regulator